MIKNNFKSFLFYTVNYYNLRSSVIKSRINNSSMKYEYEKMCAYNKLYAQKINNNKKNIQLYNVDNTTSFHVSELLKK